MSCYVIILNYNGWEDTIECLDSVFQTRNIDYKVIVCDNNSTDDSLESIKAWLDGQIKLNDVNRNTLIKTHIRSTPDYTYWKKPLDIQYDSPLLLVESGENRGFAAGNNIGIKIAINQSDCDTLFILNNDTVITPNTLYEGACALKANDTAGICSVNAKCYSNPSEANWHPMYYNPSTGKEYYIKANHIPSPEYLYKYSGMAFFVTKNFIKEIGLMNEIYFLYYEELDWVVRSKNTFSCIFANKAIVYHKGGESVAPKSPLSWFCTVRSLFLFVRCYYPKYFPKIYFFWWLRCMKRFLEGNISHGLLLLKFLLIFPFKGEQYTGGFFTYYKKIR